MGNCNCKNSETTKEMIFSGAKDINSPNLIPTQSQEKFFKLRKPKPNNDSQIKEESHTNKNTSSNNINIINSNVNTNANTNTTIKIKTPNKNDVESIDERVTIQNDKAKKLFVNNEPSNSINIKNEKTALPWTMASNVASFNFDKNDLQMFNNHMNYNTQEEAMDPLTKAFALNYYCPSKYQETKIDQRETFSLVDSASLQKNLLKDLYEETSSRETYSYLHYEIKKSSSLFTLTLKKRQKELRFHFRKWKEKNENKLKSKIIKSLALIKFRTVFGNYYKRSYYSFLITKLKESNQAKNELFESTNSKNNSNDIINQMIFFQKVSVVFIIYIQLTHRADQLLVKQIFRSFVYHMMNSQRQSD